MSIVERNDVADVAGRFVSLAAELGEEFASHAARHDRDGTFVTEAFEIMRERGYLSLAVPAELGGMGATIAEVTRAQETMARYDASASLAVTMHQHIVLFAAWRYRRGMPGAEQLLRRVVEDRIVLATTGGADWTRPNGTAVKVEGGWVVNGRKPFASQAPVADVFSMLFTAETPDGGREVIGASIPAGAPGLEMIETWDTIGMRGTGSHDLQLTDVFVPDAAATPPRPWGVIDPPLMTIALHAMPPIAGVYLGLADAARDRALAHLAGTAKADDPLVQRQVGLLDGRLRMARWALYGLLGEIGHDPEPSLALVVSLFQAKRAINDELVAACDLAMEIVGGAAYFRKLGIEQAVRDIRALKYHPLPSDAALVFAGRSALGLPAGEL